MKKYKIKIPKNNTRSISLQKVPHTISSADIAFTDSTKSAESSIFLDGGIKTISPKRFVVAYVTVIWIQEYGLLLLDWTTNILSMIVSISKKAEIICESRK